MNRIRKSLNFIVSFNTALILPGLSGAIASNLPALLHNASTMCISAASMRPCLPQKRGTKETEN